jgi:hypothetical protein
MLEGAPEPIGGARHAPCEAGIEAGLIVPNCNSSAGSRLAMASSDQPDQRAADGIVAADEPACVALVPLASAVHWPRVPEQRLSRADFVTQLIATAEHVPQTRTLRRATPADAKAAYGRSGHNAPFQPCGGRTRQVV